MKNTLSNIPSAFPTDLGDNPKGIIHTANEARFRTSHYNEPLTSFSVGWKDPENLRQLLEFIAPSVPVSRRFEFKRADNSEAFFSEADDLRAIGSSFKRIDHTGETVNEKTLNKGLTIRIDHDDMVGDNWQERHVHLLIQRLMRNELRRAIQALSLVCNDQEAIFPQDGSASDPDGLIRKVLMDAANLSGIRPNRILIGERAWDLRANCYSLQANAGAFRSSDLNKSQLAGKLNVEGVEIASARYQTATDEQKVNLVGKEIYMYYALEGITKDEPSNIKRFYTPAENSDFRVYLDEHAKYTDISVEHYSNIVITSSLGLEKITVKEA